VELYKAYVLSLLVGTFLATMINHLEGDMWLGKRGPHVAIDAVGNTAIDECLWFVFCTMHGVAMNDFMPRDVGGRLIGMAVSAFAYWFPIYMVSIVLLHQLPGERSLSAYGVAERLVVAVWPSYLLMLGITCYVGAMMGPYVSDDPAGHNEWPSGIYWLWTVVHRQPFGDIYPDTPFGRAITVPAAWLSVMYMPYAVACVAVRKPTSSQHASLLTHLRDRPEDAFGRGYIMPEGDECGREILAMCSSAA
jgi:hypothetical protein